MLFKKRRQKRKAQGTASSHRTKIFSSLNLNTASPIGNIFSSFTPSEIHVCQRSFFMRLSRRKKVTSPRVLGRLNYALWIDSSTKYNHHRRQFQSIRRFAIGQNLRYVKSSCHPCTGLPRSKNILLRPKRDSPRNNQNDWSKGAPPAHALETG